ncbi:uncharacterized protein LOC126645422 isoform X1 [Myiozetetes cayanensis]|uniref:uncharacterized protein LOC126645422 isoform X1 n=1 Tax=Myiozetetes cayanensis TaxID=478635 RepID=UPI00215EE6E9|nr:uncharacterized protein LOC126645422 isoform X1 [Myiozetetes cayanensis]XP_050181777.1 uncharacterized protein LOC126645422 isoform X1 [Myiozetetes cayanensis]
MELDPPLPSPCGKAGAAGRAHPAAPTQPDPLRLFLMDQLPAFPCVKPRSTIIAEALNVVGKSPALGSKSWFPPPAPGSSSLGTRNGNEDGGMGTLGAGWRHQGVGMGTGMGTPGVGIGTGMGTPGMGMGTGMGTPGMGIGTGMGRCLSRSWFNTKVGPSLEATASLGMSGNQVSGLQRAAGMFSQCRPPFPHLCIPGWGGGGAAGAGQRQWGQGSSGDTAVAAGKVGSPLFGALHGAEPGFRPPLSLALRGHFVFPRDTSHGTSERERDRPISERGVLLWDCLGDQRPFPGWLRAHVAARALTCRHSPAFPLPPAWLAVGFPPHLGIWDLVWFLRKGFGGTVCCLFIFWG